MSVGVLEGEGAGVGQEEATQSVRPHSLAPTMGQVLCYQVSAENTKFSQGTHRLVSFTECQP